MTIYVHDRQSFLEIGCYEGIFTGTDNFTEFNDNGLVKKELTRNINKLTNSNVCIIENDSFCVDIKTLTPKFNIFLYDGKHTYKAHLKVLSYILMHSTMFSFILLIL